MGTVPSPYIKLSEEKQLLAAKCIQTLINNYRIPHGELKHAGVFPSYHQGYFNGFWAWDSWKHAVALSLFEPEMAKDQVRAMFDFQDNEGMIADAVFADTLLKNTIGETQNHHYLLGQCMKYTNKQGIKIL